MESKDKLAEYSYSSEYLQVMWDSLKYLEAIKYVGKFMPRLRLSYIFVNTKVANYVSLFNINSKLGY